jgi:hypothetical protein
LVGVAVLGFALAGCGGSGGEVEDRAQGDRGEVWTVLVYLNADNSLEGQAAPDIQEMIAGTRGNRVTVLVQLDLESTQQGQRIRIANGSSEIVETLPEPNMADPRTLSEFLAWGLQMSPTGRHAVVLWNHGTGWRSRSEGITRGISYDSSAGCDMRIPQVRSAFETFPAVDLLGFDACLMQMVEVAYELRDAAAYIVASEDNVPGTGWNYTTFLSALGRTGHSSRAAAETAVASYVNEYERIQSMDITMSAIDTSQLQRLVRALDDFSVAARMLSSKEKSQQARADTLRFAYADYRDLEGFVENLERQLGPDAPHSEITELKLSIKAAVAANAARGHSVANASGLAIWLPGSRSYAEAAEQYAELELAQAAPQWPLLLQSYQEP